MAAKILLHPVADLRPHPDRIIGLLGILNDPGRVANAGGLPQVACREFEGGV